MADENITLGVSIDEKELKSSFKDFQAMAEKEFGDTGKSVSDEFTKNLSFSDRLKEGFDKFSIPIIALNQGLELTGKVLSAVADTAKFFVDQITKAEQIRVVNQQFELLAQQSGIVASNLKEGLVGAAQGLVDDEDLLRSSSRALIELGESANRLPQIFEIARKASSVFGGDVINNFESINQAISTGNVRQLRQIGIVLDSEKVFKDYADSLNTTSDRLSLAGRQQALLNAVLEKGSTAFKNVNADAIENTNAFKRVAVQLKELGDTFAQVFADSIGPFARKTAESISGIFDGLNTRIKASRGDVGSQIKLLEDQINTLNKDTNLQLINPGAFKIQVDAASKELSRLQDIQRASLDDAKRAAGKLAEPGQAPSLINLPSPEEVAANAAKFQQALIQAQDQNLQLQVNAAQKIRDIDERNLALDSLDVARKEQIERDLQLRLAKIREEFSIQKGFTLRQELALENQARIDANLKIEQLEKESDDRRKAQSLQISATLRGILVSGISKTAESIGVALQKGQDAFAAFTSGIGGLIGDLLIGLGNATIGIGLAKIATEAFTFGSGFATVAAGAALVALGAAFKSSQGGLSGASSSTAGSITGGGSAGFESSPVTEVPGAGQIQGAGTSVVVNVQGNILDRRQSGLELIEVIQDAFDTQGARVTGGSFA